MQIMYMKCYRALISSLCKMFSFLKLLNMQMLYYQQRHLLKEGTFTNTERRVQRLYQVLPTLGDAKPDWWIVQEVANKLGANWNYSHPSEIFAEMASLSPLFSQANYEVLEGWNSFHWGSFDGTNTPLLFQDGFNFPDKRLVLRLLTGYVQLNFQLSLTFTLTTVVCLSISMKGI